MRTSTKYIIKELFTRLLFIYPQQERGTATMEHDDPAKPKIKPYKAFFADVDAFGRKRLRRTVEEALRRLDSENATEEEKDYFEQIIFGIFKALRLQKRIEKRVTTKTNHKRKPK